MLKSNIIGTILTRSPLKNIKKDNSFGYSKRLR